MLRATGHARMVTAAGSDFFKPASLHFASTTRALRRLVPPVSTLGARKAKRREKRAARSPASPTGREASCPNFLPGYLRLCRGDTRPARGSIKLTLLSTQRWACKTKLLARLQTFCSARYGYVVFCLSTFFGLLRAAWRRVKLLQ